MENKRGMTIVDRLNEDIEYARNINDVANRTLLATKALGAVDLAVEFGMITYTQWELYINDIFTMM